MTKALLNKKDIGRILSRIAHEIVEHNRGCEGLCLVGVYRAGVPLARRLALRIKSIEDVDVPVASLDITFYRDDLSIRKDRPVARKTDIPFDINNRKLILIDDVLFTGRSIRAAMDALIDFGRPSQIQLAVLIDRGHRELPIRADYTGKVIPTARTENIKVYLEENGDRDEVLLFNDQSTQPQTS